MSHSEIERIVDYTAAVAGRIEGIKATFGAGIGATEDPLRPGQPIAAAPGKPTAALTHWSDCPDAPPVQWVSQEGTVELTWTIPMRLWFARADLADVRRMSLPFYDRYIEAFVLDRTLGGLALRTQVTRFNTGGDANWSWLDIGLMVVERVNYYAV
jgi:hypothetical protein